MSPMRIETATSSSRIRTSHAKSVEHLRGTPAAPSTALKRAAGVLRGSAAGPKPAVRRSAEISVEALAEPRTRGERFRKLRGNVDVAERLDKHPAMRVNQLRTCGEGGRRWSCTSPRTRSTVGMRRGWTTAGAFPRRRFGGLLATARCSAWSETRTEMCSTSGRKSPAHPSGARRAVILRTDAVPSRAAPTTGTSTSVTSRTGCTAEKRRKRTSSPSAPSTSPRARGRLHDRAR